MLLNIGVVKVNVKLRVVLNSPKKQIYLITGIQGVCLSLQKAHPEFIIKTILEFKKVFLYIFTLLVKHVNLLWAVYILYRFLEPVMFTKN